MLLLRHALASLLNYGTHMSRFLLNDLCLCRALGYLYLREKIDIVSLLALTHNTPSVLDMTKPKASR